MKCPCGVCETCLCHKPEPLNAKVGRKLYRSVNDGKLRRYVTPTAPPVRTNGR